MRCQRSSETSQSTRSCLSLVIFVLVLAFVLAFLLRGRILAAQARRNAAGQMDAGAFLTAEQWLAWAVWFDPEDGRTDLMRAACFRHMGQKLRWYSAMDSAKRKRVPTRFFDRESYLGKIHFGTPVDQEGQAWAALVEAGLLTDEIAAVFVHGYLVLEQPEKAKNVLDRWMVNDPEGADVACMAGVYWRSLGEHARAEREFERALTIEPRHQLACTRLAELLEAQFRLAEALEQWVELATVSDGSDTAVVSVARVLRQLGYLDEARSKMEWLASRSELSTGFAIEMGHIEIECGNYKEAQRWFEQLGIDQTGDVLISAAGAFALNGKRTRADQFVARRDHVDMQSRRSYDLRIRLAVDPYDKGAAVELERLNTSPHSEPMQGVGYVGTQAAQPLPQSDVGEDLYTLHCAVCHGQTGDGNGPAAHHLHPRPRNLRSGRSRLVSTWNSVPALEDIESVLMRGMPGTSMPSFEDLSPDQLKSLAQRVLQLNRDGVREQLLRARRHEGGEINTDELREIVELRTTPGKSVQVPTIGPADLQAIARGKDAYFKFECDNCHGEHGSGPWEIPLYDDSGRPSVPRDLVSEPFKGGDEPESIYLRIFLGMPGSPHPACPSIAQEHLIDLVHYCRSLSREPKWTSTNYQRSIRAARRANVPAPVAAP